MWSESDEKAWQEALREAATLSKTLDSATHMSPGDKGDMLSFHFLAQHFEAAAPAGSRYLFNLRSCLSGGGWSSADAKDLEARLRAARRAAPATREGWLTLIAALPLSDRWRLFMRRLATRGTLRPANVAYIFETKSRFKRQPPAGRPADRPYALKYVRARIDGEGSWRETEGCFYAAGEACLPIAVGQPLEWHHHPGSSGKWYGRCEVREDCAVWISY